MTEQILQNQPLIGVFLKVCEFVGKARSGVTFKFDGGALGGDEIPESLELENGDLIDVFY